MIKEIALRKLASAAPINPPVGGQIKRVQDSGIVGMLSAGYGKEQADATLKSVAKGVGSALTNGLKNIKGGVIGAGLGAMAAKAFGGNSANAAQPAQPQQAQPTPAPASTQAQQPQQQQPANMQKAANILREFNRRATVAVALQKAYWL